MKTLYNSDINALKANTEVLLKGWVKSKRRHGNVLFLDLADSTGDIQCIVSKATNEQLFKDASALSVESAIACEGLVKEDKKNNKEVEVTSLTVYSGAKQLSPKLREKFDIFSESYADHTLKNRHLYIRNPRWWPPVSATSNPYTSWAFGVRACSEYAS